MTQQTTDRDAIESLAEQDVGDDVEDSYASTGDAPDTIRRWYAAAAAAGDTDLCETIDRLGVLLAAEIYEDARQSPRIKRLAAQRCWRERKRATDSEAQS